MTEELKKIKKHFGEDLAHLCRDLFPTILEHEGELFKILTSNFSDNKFLYEDIINHNLVTEFKNFIYGKFDATKEDEQDTCKSPSLLLDEAGYILYECKSESDIQNFKKYYAKGEELCTFRGGRLNDCYVFFAIKKNVADIKREDFKHPKREDEYGTSVISIQFSRGTNNILSIKNRYNHTVSNPDCTFSNNLDNIIPGLNHSFEKAYGFHKTNSNAGFSIINCGYVKANDGRYYKYNYEIDNIYYCINNNIINSRRDVIDRYQDKEKYLLVDYFIIDLTRKSVYSHTMREDRYVNSLYDIKSITIKKDNFKNKHITIIFLDGSKIVIESNKYNQIIKLYDNHTINLNFGSLKMIYLEELLMPNVSYISDYVLTYACNLKKISIPLVHHIGHNFLSTNKMISKIYFPLLKTIGSNFMCSNQKVTEIYLPKVTKIDHSFFSNNKLIKSVRLPNVTSIGSYFLQCNDKITSLSLPKVESIGSDFLFSNNSLKEISMPKLKEAGDFLMSNRVISKVNFPRLQIIGRDFMAFAANLRKIYLPNVTSVGNRFLADARHLREIYMPKLEEAGSDFLIYNNDLTSIDLPSLKTCDSNFLYCNEQISYANFPNLTDTGTDFMHLNNALTELILPKLIFMGPQSLYFNNTLKRIVAPNLTQMGLNSLYHNTTLTFFEANLDETDEILIHNPQNYEEIQESMKCKRLVRNKDGF